MTDERYSKAERERDAYALCAAIILGTTAVLWALIALAVLALMRAVGGGG